MNTKHKRTHPGSGCKYAADRVQESADLRSKSVTVADRLLWRQSKYEQEVAGPHGKVKVLFKDGKPVTETPDVA